MKVTGRITSRRARFIQGLAGCAVVLALLLPFLLTGRLNFIEYRGLDLLQRRAADSSLVSDDIVIVYVDQKSLDFFRYKQDTGWPWPRDFYAGLISYMQASEARAVVFDFIFSEPSVYARTQYGDDEAFGAAMEQYGRVIQAVTFQREPKKGVVDEDPALAAERDRELDRLSEWSVDYIHRGGRRPLVYRDATVPIEPIREPAWAIGDITVEPETDGVIRRLRLISGFRDGFYPTLALAAFLKTGGEYRLTGLKGAVRALDRTIPLDRDGKTLVKFYGGGRSGGGSAPYRGISFVAVLKSLMDMGEGKTPPAPPDLFKDKIVLVGASAAGLQDLRAFPVADSLPGVELHAHFLNNLLAGDFLRPASAPLQAGLVALLLIGTVTAAVYARGVAGGAVLSASLFVLYLGAVYVAFRNNVWLDFITPLGGQLLVFIAASLINYYGEGREKSAVRGAFSHYLSPDVVTDVLENPGQLSLGGERRVMTAFFSDLAGFTSISESLSPEDLVRLLNRYLSMMTRNIMDRGGTVDKFEGDAVMAFWGAPVRQEDHALRACLSALDQQKLIDRLRLELLDEGLPEINVRMGVNTGPMIVGNMGSEERFDYTVMGDAVNLASRLEGANKPYGTYIMISEFTYEEVRERVEVRELDLLRVKGKKEPIRVYELLAEKGGVSADKAAAVKEYLRGLQLYRDMDFSAAEEAFAAALALDPADGPSRAYIERCRVYRDNPPPADWDRVFTMTSK